jgi:hypothetical protein
MNSNVGAMDENPNALNSLWESGLRGSPHIQMMSFRREE